MTYSIKHAASFLLLAASLVVTGACDSGGGEGNGGGDTSGDTETASAGLQSADVITGATPGVESVRLDNAHPGWGQASCQGCHEGGHQENYVIGDCVSCHGVNGAPRRTPGHVDRGCVACHAERHPELDLSGDDGCRACHGAVSGEGGCAFEESYDVVVIGGGGGGLAAAAMLAKGGSSVLLVEQHYKVGGCMVTFDRGEYRFEASLHAYDGWGLSYLNALGIRDSLVEKRGDIMYRLVYPDMTFDVPADLAAYREALKEAFPDEIAAIDDLFDGFDMGDGLEGMSLLDAVLSFGIRDDRLISIFTVLSGFLAATPDQMPADEFAGMWGSYHRMGYYYFEGGSQAITDALEAAVLEGGGVIKRHTRAERITVREGRATGITTSDGGCYTAEAVISNASPRATLLGMVGEDQLPAAAVAEIEGRAPAPSNLAVIFLGVDEDYTALFEGGAHEVFVTRDNYITLGGISEVACQPEAVNFVITNYSVPDPHAALEGKNAIVITVDFMDYDCGDEWSWGTSYDSYEEYKANLADAVITRVGELLPGLADHIEVMEVASPRTVEQFTLNDRGSWAGWAFESGEEHIYTDTLETPVEGLYLVGAWTGGAGQSVALSTGLAAAGAVSRQINTEDERSD